MDPDTVEKLRYRVNLHAGSRSPVSLGKRAKRRQVEKRTDFVEAYQTSLLQEKSLLSVSKYSLERTQPSKREARRLESSLDPVQDHFIKALRERLDTFLRKPMGARALGTLSILPRRREASGLTPAPHEIGNDVQLPAQSSPYGVNLPKLAGHRYGRSIFSQKTADSLSTVFQNQVIRNACSQHKPSQSLKPDTQTHDVTISPYSRLQREDLLTDMVVGRSLSPGDSRESEDKVGLEWTVPWRVNQSCERGKLPISLSSKNGVRSTRRRPDPTAHSQVSVIGADSKVMDPHSINSHNYDDMRQSVLRHPNSPLRATTRQLTGPFALFSPVNSPLSDGAKASPISLSKKSPGLSLPILQRKTPLRISLAESPLSKRDGQLTCRKPSGERDMTERKDRLHRRTSSDRALVKASIVFRSTSKPPRPSAIAVSKPGIVALVHRKIQSLQASPRQKQDLSTSSSENCFPPVVLDPQEQRKLIAYVDVHYNKLQSCPATLPSMYAYTGELGTGASGKVYSALHKLTGKLVAIKCISKQYLEERNHRGKIAAEVAIMKRFTNKHIVRLLEVFEANNGDLNIVMEYVSGGDLLQYVREKGKLEEPEAKLLFRQIVEGAQVIHAHEILHRDLKLENLLLDANSKNVKICDFGISRSARPGLYLHEQSGTPAFLAPEVIAGGGYEGFSSDVWSLGVCLYVLLSGRVPFRGLSHKDLQKAILKGMYVMPETISDEAKGLIAGMLQLVPNNRPTLDQVISHSWLSGTPADTHSTCARMSTKETLIAMRSLGFPPEAVLRSLKDGDCNHATATYYLLVHC